MRPVVRGKRPKEKGKPIELKKYGYARGHLIQRIGEYCSYCETKLNTSLAVEHVLPKKATETSEEEGKRRELDWDNLLLACTNCNSTKSNQEVSREKCLWPDRDNTFMAIEYSEGGLVSPNQDMPLNIIEKAEKLIQLVGLDKTPSDEPIYRWEASDRRWLHRKETWDMATRKRDQLKKIEPSNDETFRNIIVDLAKSNGRWSIWMTVFQNDEDMCRRLIDGFNGTCKGCFDDNMKPIHREGGLC
ncbi:MULTISPECIES: HNH endonuclease [Dethiosulfovibrio]|uniref:HNH domain-containing protein n=3 Tax=Dethiosulfovibrio TaxID=47054 RepID=D2Z632_9BACT|nr:MULTISPECIES: HNH endonuclease signature motif containing protein [Dethiosulfovibrio]EFC90929.1 conserved hypothetical protein [Dethiosulfovibrio peptidovorans DSM 11002]MCF4113291.1 HNH endonuclease [Dethiosulfovibrio russensis]MCF4142355.1 HNH endonuclease [Dethiosulfovibrio marinus]MCF4145633.1 HNH endonuclease [Dethiosulfovibrio acidaminovorans]